MLFCIATSTRPTYLPGGGGRLASSKQICNKVPTARHKEPFLRVGFPIRVRTLRGTVSCRPWMGSIFGATRVHSSQQLSQLIMTVITAAINNSQSSPSSSLSSSSSLRKLNKEVFSRTTAIFSRSPATRPEYYAMLLGSCAVGAMARGRLPTSPCLHYYGFPPR